MIFWCIICWDSNILPWHVVMSLSQTHPPATQIWICVSNVSTSVSLWLETTNYLYWLMVGQSACLSTNQNAAYYWPEWQHALHQKWNENHDAKLCNFLVSALNHITHIWKRPCIDLYDKCAMNMWQCSDKYW